MISTLLLLINVNVITVINVNVINVNKIMLMKAHTVNNRVYRQMLIYLMTVITTTSTLTHTHP